ncbi:protein phosphatase 1 regulatory subunit 3A [Salminus brasiliensis]|uniref:protein phosphatase 1 regulatory subunit 3A n=1 Tax=Salminus brasiliensis TaxID=930266 RepID=UPI003B831F52
MEPVVGEVWSSGRDGSNLLGLPGPCPWDDDDEPLGLGGIKPKSSPIPRRRSSDFSCSDDECQPPPSSSRRVSFADAFGLSLVSVKQFDSWAMCGTSDPLEGDLRGSEVKEYFLSLLFTLPPTAEELIQKVHENKLELESLELLPGTTTLKGTIRVLNLCFDKLVYIRTSLDCWSSHFDLLAEYIPGSSDGDMDCFSFRLTLVPPFGEQGARVDFCLRYETPFGSFWANNSGQNYVLFCHEKAKDQSQNEKKHTKKSCLKSTSFDCSSETSSTSSTEDIPEIILNCGMAALTEPVKEDLIKLQGMSCDC